MYNEIRLERALYNLNGKSFTATLEELDPTSVYMGTPLENLDAFERQLRRFNIRISGQDCDCVEKFFSSTETAVLFPEFVTRCIRKGFDEAVIPVCAAKTMVNSGQYPDCVSHDTATYSVTAQARELPTAMVEDGTTATVLEEFGRVINVSYEAIRLHRLNVFSIMLRSIGVKLAHAVTAKAVSILAVGSDQITASILTYNELAALYGKFDCFDMTTVIASPKNASIIAAMKQITDRATNHNGKLILPFGSELVKAAVANNKIIGLDRNFALEFITSADLIMETDKLIDRQLDQITVSITCGFRKVTPEAVKVLVIG